MGRINTATNVLRRKFRTLARLMRESRELLAAFDGPRTWQLVLDNILHRERLRRAEIDGFSLALRSCSPDIKVAISSLHEREFDAIPTEAARFIVDAGANIGTSALYFSRRYPSALIIAIEPDPGNFQLLQENVRDIDNIVPVQRALTGIPGAFALVDPGTGYWGYTVKPGDQVAENDVVLGHVDTCSLPDLLREFGIDRLDILKLDIEGGEKQVFDHCANWIDQVSLICIETHDRIVDGCTRAFHDACSAGFDVSGTAGEKYLATRREGAAVK